MRGLTFLLAAVLLTAGVSPAFACGAGKDMGEMGGPSSKNPVVVVEADPVI